jgi:Tfp pilus assembly protein FimT
MLNRSRVQGFTLVEMMVALVLALLVTASVLAFIFSIIRANSETVLSTRLNQELRATMAVVANELKRARAVEDPISSVGQDGSIDYDNDGDVDAVDADYPIVMLEKAGAAVTADGDCIRYAYFDGTSVIYRAIYLDAGRISMLTAGTRAGAPCTGGTPINAPNGIEITDLSIDYDSAANKRRASIEIEGGLKEPPAYMTENQSMAIKGKTIRQVVSIRSNDA